MRNSLGLNYETAALPVELRRRRLRGQCVALEFEKSSANAGIASVAIQLAGKILPTSSALSSAMFLLLFLLMLSLFAFECRFNYEK